MYSATESIYLLDLSFLMDLDPKLIILARIQEKVPDLTGSTTLL